MSQLVIINAPYTFTVIWKIISRWLSPDTLKKINILGGVKEHQPFLLDLVDEQNLPFALGGKCTCDGLGGCELSNEGPWKEDPVERRERRAREASGQLPRTAQEPGKPETVQSANSESQALDKQDVSHAENQAVS